MFKVRIKIVYQDRITYRYEYFRENEKYIIEFYKETLKNKLIDDWSMIEDE